MSYFTFDGENVIDKLKSFGGQAVMTDRDTNIGGSVSNNFQDSGSRHLGQTYTYDNVNPKSIPVTVVLIGTMRYINLCTGYLSTLLLSEGLHKLEFSDRPNIVWDVKGDGQASVSYSRDGSPFMATVSMTFIAPKAYGESKNEQTVSTTQTSDKNGYIEQKSPSEYVLHLNNAGSALTRPVISIDFKSDNGYIGLYDSNGSAYEVGNIEESDDRKYKQSEEVQVYMNDESIAGSWKDAEKNVAASNVAEDYTKGTTYVADRFGFKSLTIGDGNTSSLTWNIPVDSNKDGHSDYGYLWWRQLFWAGRFTQRGFIKVIISDENNNFLYGVETIKRGFNADTEYNFLVTDGKGGFQTLASHHFIPTNSDYQNPFNKGRGYSDILRQGDWLQFFWWGSYQRFYCPQLEGRKNFKVNFIFSKLNSEAVTHMLIRTFHYRKDNVDKVENIPNLFFNGANFTLNNVDGTSTLNGVNTLSKVVHGSDTLLMPTGKSDIVLNLSDWNKTKPDIKVSWKERYLR